LSESAGLSLERLQLLDALQVAPRAPWTAIARAVGITPVTAAKRWDRLHEAGIAWVTGAPAMAVRHAQCLAYVEITCHPEHRLEVARAIAQHSMAVTVELTTGSADILATVAAADLPTMSHYLLEHLDRVEYVRSTRARFATRLYGEGSRWRIGELPPATVDTLQQVVAEQIGSGQPELRVEMSDSVKAMMIQLSQDGRTPIAELAERSGLSQTGARRRLAQLRRSRMVVLRADVSRRAVGWPVQVYLWAHTPVESLNETAHALSRLRESRLTATVTAGPNLALCAWLRTVEEVHRLELSIAARLPHVEIIDRLLVLRTIKRMGRLIDESGRAAGVVPINVWDDLLPHEPVRDGPGHPAVTRSSPGS
jgi:DNA-binding Lrp family transcriptional regulator